MDCRDNNTHVLSKEQISLRTAEANSQLQHYLYRIGSLWKRSPSLQKIYINPDDPKFGAYIDMEGILFFRELQDCGVELPSWQDMITVGGETDSRIFLQIGRSCYESIVNYLPKKIDTLRVLDFGVGCGRTARHFYRDLKQYEIHGCDVDAHPIEFLFKSVPFIQPLLSSNLPPLPYKSSYFDAIYSVSVFSHLKSSAFGLWAEELSRCLKSGGILLITIHGTHALNLTRNKEDVSSIGINDSMFRVVEARFPQDGFIWIPQATTSEDIDTSQYGISFIERKYLEEHLPSNLEVIHYGVGEIGNWQDLVVLRKK